MCGSIAISITMVFYFKRTFHNDGLLMQLSIIQFLSAVLAFVFGVIFVRSRIGRITLSLSIVSILGLFYLDVGVH